MWEQAVHFVQSEQLGKAIFTRLLTSIAVDIIKSGYLKLKTAALGKEDARKYQHILAVALATTIGEQNKSLSWDEVSGLEDIIRRFLSDDEVIFALISLSISDTNLDEGASELSALFDKKGFDETTLQVSLKDFTSRLLNLIKLGVKAEAQKSGSVIYNYISLEYLESIHTSMQSLRKEFEAQKTSNNTNNAAALALQDKLSEFVEKASFLRGEQVDAAVQLYRQGRKNEAEALLSTIRDDSNWHYYSGEIRARVLKTIAVWKYNKQYDLEEIKALIEQAKTQNPAGDYRIINALITLRTASKECALEELGDPTAINHLNVRMRILLVFSQFNQVLEELQNSNLSNQFDGETYAEKALAQAYTGDLSGAEISIEKALLLEPQAQSIKLTKCQIFYLKSLSGPVFPKQYIHAPAQNIPFFRRKDKHALENLKIAQDGFASLLEAMDSDDPVRKDTEIWYLSALDLDYRQSNEVEAQCKILLTNERFHYDALVWGMHLNLPIPKEALDYAATHLGANSAYYLDNFSKTVLALVYSGHVENARQLLENSKDICAVEEERKNVWHALNVHVLLAEFPNEVATAEKELELITDNERVSELKSLIRYRHTEPLKDTTDTILSTSTAVTNDALDIIKLAIECHERANRGQWQFIADNATRLVAELNNAWAISITSSALWNTGNPEDKERCYDILNSSDKLFPEEKLPEDLETLKISCLLKLGRFPAAIECAEKLYVGSKNTENLITYVEALIHSADTSALKTLIRKSLDKVNIPPKGLLRIAQIILTESPEQAKECWNKAVKEIDKYPEIVFEAYQLAFRLNLERQLILLQPYFDRMVSQGDSRIKLVDLSTVQTVMQERREASLRINDLYNQASIPIHLLAERNSYPLAALYFTQAQDNHKKLAPVSSPIIFAFHGGRAQSTDFNVNKLFADITGIFTASRLGILDKIIEQFHTINIPHSLPVALIEQLDELSQAQLSRVESAQLLRKLVEQKKITIFSDETLNSEISQKASPAYIVQHELSAEQLSSLNAGKSNLIDSSLIIESAKAHQYLSEEECNEIQGLFRKNPEHTALIPIGALLYFTEYTLINIAHAGILEAISNCFSIFVSSDYYETAINEVQIEQDLKATREEITKLKEKITEGMDKGSIIVLPDLSASKFEDDNFLDKKLTTKAFADLVRKIYSGGDYVWADDRYLNGYQHINSAPILSTLDILALLHAKGKLSAGEYYSKRNILRASNYRYIPLTEAELTFHLQHAPIVNGQLQETDELKIIRKYHNACLLHADLFQLPPLSPPAPNPNGEIPFLLASHAAIAEAIMRLWQNHKSDLKEISPRADWILDNIYTGMLGHAHLLSAKNPAQDPIIFGAMEVVSLLQRGLSLRSFNLGDDDKDYRQYCQWIEHNFAKYRLAQKEAIKVAATNIESCIAHLYKEVANTLTEAPQKTKNSWIKAQSHKSLVCLPSSIIEELTSDKEFNKKYSLTTTNLITIGQWSFAPGIFFRAIKEAIEQGKSLCALYSSPTKDMVFDLQSFENDVPSIRIYKDGTKNGHNVKDAIFSLTASNIEQVKATLGENSDEWFDLPKQGTKRIIRKTAAQHDAIERAISVSKLRANSAQYKYMSLERALNNNETITTENLKPISLNSLIQHYRLEGLVESDSVDNNFYAGLIDELINDLGITKALERILWLPIQLPDILFSTITNLPIKERELLLDEAIRKNISPTNKLQILDIIYKCYTDVPSLKEKADQIINQLISIDFTQDHNLFSCLLEYSYRHIALLIRNDELIPLPLRLLLSWAHASRLYNILYPAKEQRADLLEFIKAGIPQNEFSSIFGRDPNDQRDLLSPTVVHAQFFNVHRLLKVLNQNNVDLVKDEETTAYLANHVLTKVGDAYMPALGLLLDPTLCTNKADSFFAGDRKEIALGVFDEDLSNVISCQRLKSEVSNAISTLNKDQSDEGAWILLTTILASGNIYEDLSVELDNLLLSLNAISIAEKNCKSAIYAANFICKAAKYRNNPALVSHSKDFLYKLAQFIEANNLSDEDMDHLANRLVEGAYQLSLAEETPEKASYDFSQTTLRLVRTSTKLVQWIGDNFVLLVRQLPIAQLKGIWQLVLEIRARY